MNGIGATILVVLIGVVLVAPRRWAVLGMIAGVLYLTQVQAVNLLALNVFAVRFLELAGFIRVMSRREFSFARLNKLDKALIALYIFTAIVYCLSQPDGKAYIVGTAVDAFLCYFTLRGLVYDLEDLEWILCRYIWLLAPYAALVMFESATHHNPFAFIGGGMYDWVRGDRFRCVGTFRNPDLLGTLGASFFPLYLGLVFSKTHRNLAVFGAGLCLLLVWASNSGGPVCATMVGMIGWGFWKVRLRMQIVRRIMVVSLVATALVMKAPIWYLLARMSEFTGGDGWHRAFLLDISFQHLNLWWLSGMNLNLTADWFAYGVLAATGGADITNQFLSFGLNAGLGAIALLILVLVRGFSSVGKALDNIRSSASESNKSELMVWSLGVMLASHIANWMGITYFDQIYVIWFLQLATISGISEKCAEPVMVVANDETEAQEGQTVFSPEDQVYTN